MSFLTDEQLDGHKVVQVAFAVDDLEQAALAWANRFGAGPFFVYDPVPVNAPAKADGSAAIFDQSAAFGQWGPVMVELVKWNDLEPGLISDTMGKMGFNHIAYFVKDANEERVRLEQSGAPVVLSLKFGDVPVHFHDARKATGFVIEHYPFAGAAEEMFRKVAEAADGWNGKDPLRGPIGS